MILKIISDDKQYSDYKKGDKLKVITVARAGNDAPYIWGVNSRTKKVIAVSITQAEGK